MKKKKTLETLEDSFVQALEGREPAQSETLKAERQAPEGDLKHAEAMAGISFEISDDAMQVVMRAKDATAVTIEQIVEALRKQRVVAGVDRATVHVAVERIAKDGGWHGGMVVVRGKAPESPYELDFPFLQPTGPLGAPNCVWLVDGMPLFPYLPRLFSLRSLEELDSFENVFVKAVRPKDVIVRVVKQGQGRPGKNIYGEEIKDEGFPLQIGANISSDENNRSYVSEVYGYVLAEGNRLSVLEPIWISPDKMAAHFINLPQLGEPAAPSSDDLVAVLLKRGVHQSCLHNKAIAKFCEKLQAGDLLPRAIKIAGAIKPKRGLDAEIQYSYDYQKRAGTMRRDGSIDLRERNAVVTVRAGDLVAEKRLATKGEPGLTLFGQTLPAQDGKDKDFQVGQGIVQEKKGERILFYAKADGNVVLRGTTLAIVEVYQVQGDVDYATGNLSVNTDLSINGSVEAGFTVRSEGNVQIQGMVESGALVIAKGNLTIGKGVVGDTTKLVTYGDLNIQFIQDAEILAKGNITIGSYAFNGLIRAGGTITVKKEMGSHAGKIVGGVVCASKGVECSTIGSEANKNTVVSLQASPEKAMAIKAYDQKLKDYEQMIMKMTRTLQLDSIDPAAIRAKLGSIPTDKKEMYTKILLRLNRTIKEKNSIALEKKMLLENIDTDLEKARIRVSSEVYQGNEIQIGTKRFIVPTDLGPSVFQLQDGKIVG